MQKVSVKLPILQQTPQQYQNNNEFSKDNYKYISYISVKPQANIFINTIPKMLLKDLSYQIER